MGFPDQKSAEDALRALKGEGEKGGRFSSRASRAGREVVVEAECADVVALRATLNAYLRYLQVIEGVKNGGQE
ncbi:MAG: KEOPS complex subunit Pcc1 [Candidatus ainarchaeum sp.]|nr:KEOPS complex subunit Pcc1 [Candidatus ainarchaeum sp.]